MAKPERCSLEHVAYTGMCVRFVAIVRWQLLVQERGKILVRDNVLQAGNHDTASTLEYLLVTPVPMLSANAFGYHIVPAQKQNGKRQ